MKRASYRAGVEWIALEDDPDAGDDVDNIEGCISVCLLADLFGIDPHRVAVDVARARRRQREDAEFT